MSRPIFQWCCFLTNVSTFALCGCQSVLRDALEVAVDTSCALPFRVHRSRTVPAYLDVPEPAKHPTDSIGPACVFSLCVRCKTSCRYTNGFWPHSQANLCGIARGLPRTFGYFDLKRPVYYYCPEGLCCCDTPSHGTQLNVFFVSDSAQQVSTHCEISTSSYVHLCHATDGHMHPQDKRITQYWPSQTSPSQRVFCPHHSTLCRVPARRSRQVLVMSRISAHNLLAQRGSSRNSNVFLAHKSTHLPDHRKTPLLTCSPSYCARGTNTKEISPGRVAT